MKSKTKKKENFDSLAYKRREQKRIRQETKGMTWKEEVEHFHRKALEGSFSYLFKRKKPQVALSREKKAHYKTR